MDDNNNPNLQRDSGESLQHALHQLTHEIIALRKEMKGVRNALEVSPKTETLHAIHTGDLAPAEQFAEVFTDTTYEGRAPIVDSTNAHGEEDTRLQSSFAPTELAEESASKASAVPVQPALSREREHGALGRMYAHFGMGGGKESAAPASWAQRKSQAEKSLHESMVGATNLASTASDLGTAVDDVTAANEEFGHETPANEVSEVVAPEERNASDMETSTRPPYNSPSRTFSPSEIVYRKKPRPSFGEKLAPVAAQLRNTLETFVAKATKVTNFFGVGNLWVLVGIGILFLGVVFLIRQFAAAGLIGPELRIAGAAIIGIVVLLLGWNLRIKRPDLALIMQGGGVGILYLTVVGSVQLYSMLPFVAAFGLLLALVGLSTYLAIAQDSRIMAHVSYMAGFLSPILISSGSGNYVGLFSYYILLNLGVIGLSRFRSWRSLYLTAFLCTTVIGGLWGSMYYQPEMFLNVECFLVAFFLIFTYFALQGSLPGTSTDMRKVLLLVDVPLAVCTPIFFIIFQALLAQGRPIFLATVIVATSALYIAITQWLRKYAYRYLERNKSTSQSSELARAVRLQAELYLVYSIVAANIALPLALTELSSDAFWRERMLTLVWAIEGASLVWVGRKHHKSTFCILGLLGIGGSLLVSLLVALRIPTYLHAVPTAHIVDIFSTDTVDYSLLTAVNIVLVAFTAAATFFAGLSVHKNVWEVAAQGQKTPQEVTKKTRFYTLVIEPCIVFKGFVLSLLDQRQKRLAAVLFILACVCFLGGTLSELRTYESMTQTILASIAYGIFSFSDFKAWLLFLGLFSALVVLCDVGAKKFSWPLLRKCSRFIYFPLGLITLAFLDEIIKAFLGVDQFIDFTGVYGELTGLDKVGVFIALGLVIFALGYDMARSYGNGGLRRTFGKEKRFYLASGLLVIFLSITAVAVASLFSPVSSSWRHFIMVLAPLAFLASFATSVFPKVLVALHRGKFLASDKGRKWADFMNRAGSGGRLAQKPYRNTPLGGLQVLSYDSMARRLLIRMLSVGAVPLVMLIVWLSFNILSKGDSAPLPYMPILNPVDLGSMAILVLLYQTGRAWTKNIDSRGVGFATSVVFWVGVFLFFHTILARACFFWGGMPFTFSGVLSDSLYQACVAILWGISGFGAMFCGHRFKSRLTWLLGMGLMVCDIFKLFLFDFTRVEPTWRIIAFMGVGVLLICTGYFVPLPPRKDGKETPDSNEKIHEKTKEAGEDGDEADGREAKHDA